MDENHRMRVPARVGCGCRFGLPHGARLRRGYGKRRPGHSERHQVNWQTQDRARTPGRLLPARIWSAPFLFSLNESLSRMTHLPRSCKSFLQKNRRTLRFNRFGLITLWQRPFAGGISNENNLGENFYETE